MITVDGIRATGLYLLEVLKAEKAVNYSRFYNEAPETEERLIADVLPFVSDSEYCTDEDLREEAHVMLDFAAWQLEDLGMVRITFLDETLIDGEHDFRIELKEKGMRVLEEGLRFRFHGPELSIGASPASEFLIAFLEAGEMLTLREVMEYGNSDGSVVIRDDCGNEYRLGTRTYAWAFEVTLWHHTREGHIEPACDTAEQEKLWSEFVGQSGRPSRPHIISSRALWDIPFRLAVAPGEVEIRHVGRVS